MPHFMSWLKNASLAVAISALVFLLWKGFMPAKENIHIAVDDVGKPGELLSAQGFHYTEYLDGEIVYQMSGEKIHDEHARIGSLRISAIKVVIVQHPHLRVYSGAGKGWVLTAREGKIISSRKRLTLTGHVRGKNQDGGTLLAKKAVVDVRSGSVQLKGGYEIKTGQRHERGIHTAL